MMPNLVKLAAAGVAASFIERKERALAAQKASIPQLPSFNDPRAVHKFFLDQISAGETALTTGNIDEAVTHFAYAIVVCGQPTHLLQVLQASLSPNIFSKVIVLATKKPSTVQIEEELE
nr:Mitochondrial import receptor subunit TOM20 [Hymenolepis microstoma]